MQKRGESDLLCYIRKIVGAPKPIDISDQELISRFVTSRDEAAFSVLVERHGPMIFSTCRRMLGDTHDTEDAFQATFLVLARKANSIRGPERLGAWLHEVATRVALKAKHEVIRRRQKAVELSEIVQSDSGDLAEQREFSAMLDAELSRLPEKYRAPIVLCYLEGKTNQQAARELGWPVGTVAGRLSRARELLRNRLSRRDLVLSTVRISTLLSKPVCSVSVPFALNCSTVKSAMLMVGVGSASALAVAPRAVTLAQGVLRLMWITKLRTIAAFTATVAAAAVALGVLITWTVGHCQVADGAPESGPAPDVHEALAEHGAPRTADEQSEGRVLRFPSDEPLGVLYGREPNAQGDVLAFANWEKMGLAAGDVTIPTAKEVRLDVRSAACKDLSAMRKIQPNGIQMLYFRGGTIDDDALLNISHLNGLESIVFQNCKMADAAVKPLSKLPSLKTLWFNGTAVGDRAMSDLRAVQSLAELKLWQTKVTEQGLSELANLTSLRHLSVGHSDINDDALAHLTPFASLETLALSSPLITDQGMSHLASLRRLKYLDLTGTPIGDVGLGHLSSLKDLKYLRLTDTQVSDAGLVHLKGLTSLEELLLPEGNISDEGLANVSMVSTLRKLFIGYSPITDDGLAHLSRLENLESLMITCNKHGGSITDRGMVHIARMTRLKTLWLQLTGVTDVGLATLTQLKSLESLLLGGNQITWVGLRQLQQFPSLVELSIAGLQGSEATLRHLGALTNLKQLNLNADYQLGVNGVGTQDSDEGLAYLARLTNLETLSLSYLIISDEGLKHLAPLKSLEQLTIADMKNQITDDGLVHLEALQELEYLQIRGAITDRGLEHLSKLKSIRYANLLSRTISYAAIQQLKERVPSLQEVLTITQPLIEQRPTVGEAAPDFEIKTFDEKIIRLADLRGKVVLLYFWATWCTPCVSQTPELKELYSELSKEYNQFEMISLSLDENDHLARRHAERHGVEWPQAWIGLESPLRVGYGVQYAPHYVVIGRDGKFVSVDRELKQIKLAVAKASEQN